jgi:lipopolysaccharide biosynthesis protein
MKNSNSWKITKPIRKAKNLIFPTKKDKKTPQQKFNNYGDLNSFLKTFYFNNETDLYVNKSDRHYIPKENDSKIIAFFLPQFHRIPENDEFWGEGFTEWTYVTRAMPLVENQYQPHLPDELGFYDLSNDETFKSQIALAKKYGIYGFCFHYYWFSGRRLLEKPIFNYLNNKELDFPFMLCWANEPWTRRWNGSEQDVLIPQKFEKEDPLKFIEDIMPFFKDERYMKIDNCPMLIVYRPQYFLKEDMLEAIEVWREYAKKEGFNDLYLINAESNNFDSEEKFENFNASVQFNSHKMTKHWQKLNNIPKLNPNFRGLIYDYENLVKNKSYLRDADYNLYRTVLVNYDNTPRSQTESILFINGSPELYQEWLENVLEYSYKHFSNDENFVFLHSWNEWGESAHLEPDRKYGFAYLEATLNAIEKQQIKNSL